MRTKNLFPITAAFMLSLCAAFTSCKNRANETPYTEIQASILKDTDPARIPTISKLGFSVDTVRLKTSSDANSLVSTVRNIKMTDEYIFILTSDERILQFSRTGEFIRKIGYKGRGPGEYLSATYFDILPEKEELYVTGTLDGDMNVYSFDGKFIRSIPLPFLHYSFVVESNGNFLFYEHYGHFEPEAPAGLTEIDPQGNYIRTVIPNTAILHETDNNLFHVAPGVIGYYSINAGDSLFHITPDTAFVAYTMKGDKQLTNHADPDERNKRGESQYKIMYCTESYRVVHFGVLNNETVLRVYYDKINKKTYTYKDWEDRGIPVNDRMFLTTSDYNGYGFKILDAGNILTNPELSKQFPEINEDSNPVLLIIR